MTRWRSPCAIRTAHRCLPTRPLGCLGYPVPLTDGMDRVERVSASAIEAPCLRRKECPIRLHQSLRKRRCRFSSWGTQRSRASKDEQSAQTFRGWWTGRGFSGYSNGVKRASETQAALSSGKIGAACIHLQPFPGPQRLSRTAKAFSPRAQEIARPFLNRRSGRLPWRKP